MKASTSLKIIGALLTLTAFLSIWHYSDFKLAFFVVMLVAGNNFEQYGKQLKEKGK